VTSRRIIAWWFFGASIVLFLAFIGLVLWAVHDYNFVLAVLSACALVASAGCADIGMEISR
jgi:hypothetical protein